jgi:SPP1 family predicted phage head-tail adaptor
MKKVRDIGGLRRKVIIEQPVDEPDDAGGFTRTWQPVDEVWCHVESLPGSEVFYGSSEQRLIDHRIRIRWRPDMDSSRRLRLGTKIFSIISAFDADNARRYMICHCREYDA